MFQNNVVYNQPVSVLKREIWSQNLHRTTRARRSTLDTSGHLDGRVRTAFHARVARGFLLPSFLHRPAPIENQDNSKITWAGTGLTEGDFGGNAHRGTRWYSMQSFGGPFHSKITWAGTGLIEGCNRRKCFYCLFIEMECILLRFPTYVIGSSLAEIVKIIIIQIKSDWLLICFTLVTKSPGRSDHTYRYRKIYKQNSIKSLIMDSSWFKMFIPVARNVPHRCFRRGI